MRLCGPEGPWNFAREPHEPLEGAGATADAGKAVGQDRAGEEVPELLLYEVRQAGALGAARGFAEKGLQVLADDRVENLPLCLPRLVGPALPTRRAGRVRSDSAGE